MSYGLALILQRRCRIQSALYFVADADTDYMRVSGHYRATWGILRSACLSHIFGIRRFIYVEVGRVNHSNWWSLGFLMQIYMSICVNISALFVLIYLSIYIHKYRYKYVDMPSADK